MNFCGSCGARVLAGARFCTGCGAAVAAPAVAPLPPPVVASPVVAAGVVAPAVPVAAQPSVAAELPPLRAAKHTNTAALVLGFAAVAVASGGVTVLLLR